MKNRFRRKTRKTKKQLNHIGGALQQAHNSQASGQHTRIHVFVHTVSTLFGARVCVRMSVFVRVFVCVCVRLTVHQKGKVAAVGFGVAGILAVVVVIAAAFYMSCTLRACASQ